MNLKYLSSAAAILSSMACTGEAPESFTSMEPTSTEPSASTSPSEASVVPTPLPPGDTSDSDNTGDTGDSDDSSNSDDTRDASDSSDTGDSSDSGNTGDSSDSGNTGDSSDTTAPTPTSTDGFQLMWEDQFDTLDTTRWTAQTHSWDGNLSQFTANNVTVADGRLQMSLTPSGRTEKPYDGVEYRSLDAITYGKVEASMRFAKGSGVVSSLVLIYTPWPPDDWNELDIECLGNTTGEVQFNHMINIPPADPVSEHLQFPEKIDLGFDPTAAFHTYTIEWLPDSVRFLVDGVVVHEPTEEISRLVLPQHVLLTIWASDAPEWAGPIDDTTAPTFAEVDWIRVYSYAAP